MCVDPFDFNPDDQSTAITTEVAADDRCDGMVVTADGEFDIGFVDDFIVGWVEADPSYGGNVNFDPCMRGRSAAQAVVVCGIVKVAADIAGGYLYRAAQCSHGMCKVLTDADLLFYDFIGVGVHVGRLGVVVIVLENVRHDGVACLKDVGRVVL